MKALDMSNWEVENSRELLDYFESNNEAKWYTDTLIELGEECDSVLEYGTWQGQSLAAFMCANVPYIVSVDTDTSKVDKKLFERLANDQHITVRILNGNSLEKIHVPYPDLLFLDTKHTYEHVKKELSIHGPYGGKYIVIHDTNYPKDKDQKVRHAVEEFVAENDKWSIYKDIEECTGMIVLKKESNV